MIHPQESSKICPQIVLSTLNEKHQNFGIKFIAKTSNLGGMV